MASQTISHGDKIANIPDMNPGEEHPDFREVQNYLRRYGYLKPEVSCTPGQLCKETSNVLTDFQKFFGLNTSGSFDPPTRSAMSAPRCGMPDVSPLAASTTGPWDHTDLTYAFGNSTSQAIGDSAAREAIRNAFRTWGEVSDPLSFEEVDPANDPDILVEWRQAADPDHSMVGGVLAHAQFPPQTPFNPSPARPLPLHFDEEEHMWVVGAIANGFDIETVALHEVGHCLGILHTTVIGAVMFPQVSSNLTLRDPQPDDLIAVRRLYPEN